MKKATVFISCGQRNETEKKFGNWLERYFKPKYDVYFAEEVHSSKPLLTSIFSALRESEYFVSFNPYREETRDVGSVFVQQEIAIAAFLKMQMISFHERGVSKIEGIASGLHLNSIEIKEPDDMKYHLDKKTKDWDPTSKNQLFLEFDNPHTNVQISNHPTKPLSNWYHISVFNGSSYEHAKSCRAYVETIEDLDKKQMVPLQYKLELIWSGIGSPSVSITKQKTRDFDAIYTIQGSKLWQFQSLQTSTVYKYPNLGDGRYKITYLVVSDNFPDSLLEVELELLNDQAKVTNQKVL